MNFETDSQQGGATWTGRLAGVVLILIALALWACLVTYDVHEVGWSLLNSLDAEAAAARACTNALGVTGLYVAGLLFLVFGAMAYYLLLLMAIEGAAMVGGACGNRMKPLIALAAMLICACAVVDIQPWVLQEWYQGFGLKGAGGALGYLDGSCVTEALMGRTWALVLLVAVHGAALVYFGRTTPGAVWRESWHLLGVGLHAFIGLFRRRKMPPESTDWMTAPEPEEPAPHVEMPRRPMPRPMEVLAPSVRQGGLPPRLKSGLRPAARPIPPVVDEPEDDFREPEVMPPPPSHRQETEGTYSPESPQAPRVHGQAPHLRPNRENLLELMQEVEEQIELDNTLGRENEREGMPRNRRLEEKMNRRMGGEPPQPAPRPTPPSRPVRDERPQEADYPLPPYELLSFHPSSAEHDEEARLEMADTQQRIALTLENFGIDVTPGDITRGPSITRYEFYPPRGLRVNRITNLSKELKLATCSTSINILAPVPGKDTVGIELANSVKAPVYLRELLQDAAFRSPKLRIPVALGKDVYGKTVIGDLAAMPHTLVAGTTGSGKSVCINSMIISMLYKFRPDELKLILVDPKVVEMQPYRALPHLACPVVTSAGRVISTLRWAVNEMEHRYKLFSKIGVRNFEDYNTHACEYTPEEEPCENGGEVDHEWVERFAADIERQAEEEIPLADEDEAQGELDFEDENNIPLHLPYIVIIIDELADLMMMVKEDLENYIARLTQKARAAGIHLVVATQTPRSNVVTGIIKANIPSRIAFKVASPLDSRIILDTTGAENLLGKVDFLFVPPGGITRMARAQGAFVSDDEVAAVVKHCSQHARQNFDQNVISEIEGGEDGGGDNGGRLARGGSDEDDELYTRCVNLVVTERKASTSLLQRRFSIGYGRAAKIMDMMEQRGVIGPNMGASRPREVLVDAP